jgi:hypothetical protein
MAYFSPRGGLGHQTTDPVEALREAEAEAEVVRREARLSRGDMPTRILVGIMIVATLAWLVMIWLNAHHVTPSWGH